MTADGRPQTAVKPLLFSGLQHWQSLLHNVRAYIKSSDLVSDREAVDDLTWEVMNEAVVQTLEKCDKYDPTRPPFPWLRKIALNQALVLQRRRRLERQHTILVGDEPTIQQVTKTAGVMSEEEMFNALEQPGRRPPYTLDDLLSLASEGDRKILELVFVQGLRGKSLASNSKFKKSDPDWASF